MVSRYIVIGRWLTYMTNQILMVQKERDSVTAVVISSRLHIVKLMPLT